MVTVSVISAIGAAPLLRIGQQKFHHDAGMRAGNGEIPRRGDVAAAF
jgi:hypothetical protein